jgi:hypothetical protein
VTRRSGLRIFSLTLSRSLYVLKKTERKKPRSIAL